MTVDSLERTGAYAPARYGPRTGATRSPCSPSGSTADALHPDHGYPLRLIAPNRPGVLQTKWVNQVGCHEGWILR